MKELEYKLTEEQFKEISAMTDRRDVSEYMRKILPADIVCGRGFYGVANVNPCGIVRIKVGDSCD